MNPVGFFVLRTPLLSVDVLRRLSAELAAPDCNADGEALEVALGADRAWVIARLRALVADPAVREAIFVASPSLDEAVGDWLRDPSRERGVPQIILRYVARMAARPIPFGLFVGCSTGELGDATRLELAPRASYRRHTRLDTHYLTMLCEELARDPALRPALEVRPSDGLYVSSGQVRFAESRTDPGTRARGYALVAVERTPYLDLVLAHARGGARPEALALAVVEAYPDIAHEDAAAFIESLLDSQVLASDLAPSITGKEPLQAMLATLRGHAAAGTATSVLEAVGRDLEVLDDAGVGAAPARYHTIAEALAPLPGEAEIARLFQVDLYKPVARATLGLGPLREIERAAELLARLSPPSIPEELADFRDAFFDRYGDATVPLAEALDEETGVGFVSRQTRSAEPSPLLEGLDFLGDPSPPRVPFGPREEHLLRGIALAARDGRVEWKLGDDDLAALSPENSSELPESFAVAATILAASPEAVGRGEYRVRVHDVTGPSGACLFGRFCHGDPALRRAVEALLAEEEAQRPDAVFAEVVHLPSGREGNILCRPLLRAYEIPFHGRSGADEAHQIPLSDLRVAVVRGRVVLRSERLGREVVPRLTTAHNAPAATLGVYRFLCALQDAESLSMPRFNWGALGRAPFLPRVSWGRVLLTSARWNLSAAELSSLGRVVGAARYCAVRSLRETLRLPRWIGVVDGDNVLPVDLDNVLHVESFVQLVKDRSAALVTELFLDEDDLTARGPEGRFAHELIVPFTRRSKASDRGQPRVTRASVARSFAPGSEWLYAKLYSGTATADAVLKEVVAPVVASARRDGDARGWFFIRYADPLPHVRLRLRGDPAGLVTRVLPALHEAARSLRDDGRLWRIQLDTYEREVERYGGDAGVALAEALFEADSDAALSVLDLLQSEGGDHARWRLALRGVHLLLDDLGLDLAQRTEVMRRSRAAFGAEHRVDATLKKQLGDRFRRERPSLEELLAARPVAARAAGDDATPVVEAALERGFDLLAGRSARLVSVSRELADHAARAALDASVAELASSFVHMHVNRLLRSEHRAQELVLYDFLLRLYESEAARHRAPRGGERAP